MQLQIHFERREFLNLPTDTKKPKTGTLVSIEPYKKGFCIRDLSAKTLNNFLFVRVESFAKAKKIISQYGWRLQLDLDHIFNK